jgi:two-component system, cell cycle sensor histidine kinase and response regulator CckA
MLCGMGVPPAQRLLAFARELQRASTFEELLVITQREVRESTGYAHAWLFVADDEDLKTLRLVSFAGSAGGLAWEVAPTLSPEGDALLEEILSSDAPVVVVDARTDARTNKVIVEQMQNRTLVNIPLRLLDKPFGAFGIGSFGDEGCRAPTEEELAHLVGMASQLSVAAGRLRFLAERSRAENERLDLERRLYRVQKLESLGILAGGVAHDFNNLLTVILARAGLLREQSELEARADVDAIIGAAERARDLAKQLLAMGRSQALHPRPIDLAERIREVMTLLHRVMPATIEIDVVVPERLPQIEADPSQIDQVLVNLCINARDAMPEGGRLTIETEQVYVNGPYVKTHPWAKAGRYLLTSVTDTGVGMSKETVERVFEPFFTTKTDPDKPGTGLGLAIAYGIVRQHGGMLHCYSELGVGTTFKIYLPVHMRAASDVGTKIAPAIVGGSERILIAEDDATLRGAIQRVLESSGYRVSVAPDGEAACQLASVHPFDLVILDVVMPQLGGPAAVHRIRAVQPKVRFILSSGYGTPESAAELVSAGIASGLLEKPYDTDALLRTVREVLDRR